MMRSTFFVVIAALGFGAVDASAAEVKVAYRGIIAEAYGAQASSFVAGQEITLHYVVETTDPDSNPDTSIGLYYSGLRELSIVVPEAGVASQTGSGIVQVGNDVLNPDPSDRVGFSGSAHSGSIAGQPVSFISLTFSEHVYPGYTPGMIANDGIPTTHLLTINTNLSLLTSAGWTTLRILAEPQNTCASEGYKGTQLTWCKNICESNLSQASLDTWIHRWINRYRDLPYCAADGTPSAK